MADVKGVFARAASLLDDPNQSSVKPANYMGQFQQAWDWLFNKLRQTDMPFDEDEVVLAGVKAGTRDLSQYAGSKQPLEFLILPRKMWWKQAGTDDTNYAEVPSLETIPDTQNVQGEEGWMWRLSTIYIPPSTIDVDIRVLGEFTFPEFVSPDDTIRMTGFTHVLAFQTASIIAMTKGNQDWVKNYSEAAKDNLEDITAKFVKNNQLKTLRVGRMSRRGRTRRRLHISN